MTIFHLTTTRRGRLLALFVAVLFCSVRVCAEENAAFNAGSTGKKNLLTAILALSSVLRPIEIESPGASKSQALLATDEMGKRLRELGLAYLQIESSGEARAKVIFALDARPPWFIEEIKAGYDESPRADLIVWDEVARSAWNKRLTLLIQSVVDDVTVDLADRRRARVSLMNRTLPSANSIEECDRIQRQIEEIAANGEEARVVHRMERDLAYIYSGFGIAEFKALLQRMRVSDNDAIKAYGNEAWNDLTAELENLDRIKFTAIDGRPVDISALRGKVVIVEFWATWCGPCIAELPDLLAVYDEYHDKGLEIIGITLENGSSAGQPGFQEKRDKLAAFVSQRGIRWPQYYDGKHWKNDFAVLFKITSIPHLILVDQTGNVIALNPSMNRLGSMVQKLLDLTPARPIVRGDLHP